MKIIITTFAIFLFSSCASSKETNYTASTPAAPVIRTFLGIPHADSIDFIRWKLTIQDAHYILQCNYGIGKPNTNGFINGGKKISLTGVFKKVKNIFQLFNGDNTFKLIELNGDLLHLLDADNSLLAGNGGWSYTLNNIKPSITDNINLTSKYPFLKDSMVYEGRTPCHVPGIIAEGSECYKLKWRIILYADAGKNHPTTYHVYGTPWREEGGRKGAWKIITGKDGRIIYQLNDAD